MALEKQTGLTSELREETMKVIDISGNIDTVSSQVSSAIIKAAEAGGREIWYGTEYLDKSGRDYS